MGADTLRLDGKVAVVTGGGGLLGAAFCRALAERGAKVLVNDLDAAAAERVAVSISESGGVASALAESVDSFEHGKNIVGACVERYGRIDCLVNSAHTTVAKPLTELTEADLRVTLDSHVTGHFACAHFAARRMIEQGDGGSLVNLVSRAMSGLQGYSAYSAAKGAILSATFSWALELARHGIRVNALSPAARHYEPGEAPSSRMPWRREAGESVDDMRARTPAAESVAPLVVYLASDASDWVSGQVIFLAGDSLALVKHPLEDRFAFLPDGWRAEDIATHFRNAIGPALEKPSMAVGPYPWMDGVRRRTR